MKFTAKNSDIQSWIKPAVIVSTVGVQSDYPDTSKITVTISKDGFVATANNGNVAVSTIPVQAPTGSVFTDGTATVKAIDLQNSLESFDKDKDLECELKGNEFVITLVSKNTDNISMPVENKAVTLPVMAKSFDKEAKLKREILIKLMNKVGFSIGYEQRKPEFLYWMLRLEPNKARSVSGNGNRFSTYDIEGDGLLETKKKLNVLFYREHNGVLEKLMPLTNGDTVTVKEYLRTKDDDPFQNQTVLELGNCVLMLLGHNPGVKWIDENTFLNRTTTTHKFVTKTSEWDGAYRSTKATMNSYVTKQGLFHPSTLTFDGKNDLVVNSVVHMKTTRTVPVADGKGKLTFKCLSKFFIEVLDEAEKDSYLQWEFVETGGPVIVRFYANNTVSDSALQQVNISAGTKESHAIFFANYNK